MTKTEMNRFRAILTAKVAELARITRHRDGIAVYRRADQLDEIPKRRPAPSRRLRDHDPTTWKLVKQGLDT